MTLHHILILLASAHHTVGLAGWLAHLHWLIVHHHAHRALLEGRQVLWAIRHGYPRG